MRLRLDVTTSATELPWRSVLAPGRGLAYELLAQAAPELGRELHERGWGPHGMVPFGYGPPVFPGAARRRGVYAVGGKGFVELGSPVADVVEAWSRALRERDIVDWGGIALRIIGVHLVEAPVFAGGRASVRTDTPVVMKVSGAGEGPGVWVLPGEPEFPGCLQHNLRRKAESLGMDPGIELDAITWIGPKRSFAVGEGAKPGAAVEVELVGAPEVLQAVWSWGLGQANAAGFGWIGHAR